MSLFQVSDSGRVSVHGHLDRDTLSKNWWALLNAEQKQQLSKQARCTLDLSDVERIDSAGLAWLINAVRDGKQHKVAVTFSDVPEKLLQLAKISDVDSLLPVE